MIDSGVLPKAELHVHIEGTFEPEHIFAFAERNGVKLKYPSVEALRAAYQFSDLQSFLDLYYEAMSALRTEQDFEELTLAYLKRAQAQNVKHAEIFFDPQAHLQRGVRFETVIDGLWSALRRSKRDFGISTNLIMCFLRDLPQRSAMDTFDLAEPYLDRIIAVGLDSAEVGNPPSKFITVFERARAHGLLTVAHAGEEGPPSYVWDALDNLKVSRIDHGVRSMEDARLVERLRRTRMPLTVCPFSNVRLRVVQTLADHPLKRMLDAGLVATVNSDDPAYFGGYVGDNYAGCVQALGLSDAEVVQLACNSFEASFVDTTTRQQYYDAVHASVTGESSGAAVGT
ncbi:MAG TPA: adenosine deaminase [Candidatus Baltobacteraceae bacterium]|jgi:adenosine deaminase|nr:adenosine deaminase [Candidatus Baltobacteraceae bacterium]